LTFIFTGASRHSIDTAMGHICMTREVAPGSAIQSSSLKISGPSPSVKTGAASAPAVPESKRWECNREIREIHGKNLRPSAVRKSFLQLNVRSPPSVAAQ